VEADTGNGHRQARAGAPSPVRAARLSSRRRPNRSYGGRQGDWSRSVVHHRSVFGDSPRKGLGGQPVRHRHPAWPDRRAASIDAAAHAYSMVPETKLAIPQ
jgi:hypothetical protein